MLTNRTYKTYYRDAQYLYITRSTGIIGCNVQIFDSSSSSTSSESSTSSFSTSSSSSIDSSSSTSSNSSSSSSSLGTSSSSSSYTAPLLPSGYYMLFDADAAAYNNETPLTLATDGQTVTRWDSSGTGSVIVRQLTESTKPLFEETGVNSKPTIKFVSSESDYLSISAAPSPVPSSSVTLAIVFKSNGDGGISCGETDPGDAAWDKALYIQSGQLRWYVWLPGAGLAVTTQNTYGDNNFHYAIITSDASTQTNFYTDLETTYQNIGPSGYSASKYTIGHAKSSAYNGYFNGEIAEYIYYGSVLSATDINNIKLYFENKYGI